MQAKTLILNPNIYYFGRFGNIMIYILYNIYKYLVKDNYDKLILMLIKTNFNKDTYIDYNILFNNEYVTIINIDENKIDVYNTEKSDFDFEKILENPYQDFLNYNYNKFINQNIYLDKQYNIIHLRLEDYLNDNVKERGYKIITQEYIDNLIKYLNIEKNNIILVTNDYENCKLYYNLNMCKNNSFIKQYFNNVPPQLLDFLTLINSNILIASNSTFSIIGGLLGRNNKIYIQYPYLSITETEKILQRNKQHDFLYNNEKIIKTNERGQIIKGES